MDFSKFTKAAGTSTKASEGFAGMDLKGMDPSKMMEGGGMGGTAEGGGGAEPDFRDDPQFANIRQRATAPTVQTKIGGVYRDKSDKAFLGKYFTKSGEESIKRAGSSMGGMGGGGGMPMSDRRSKENIKIIGLSPSGLKIYAFEYINKIFGKGVWQGVMSDEIPKNAVIKHEDGYDRVDYSKLDVEFKQIQSQ